MKYKYLILSDDGELTKLEDINDDILSAVNDGYLQLVSIVTMEEYYNHKWHPIKTGDL